MGLALFAFVPSAQALMINVEQTVTWQVPTGWTPGTPWFDGSSSFSDGIYIVLDHPPGFSILPLSTFGAATCAPLTPGEPCHQAFTDIAIQPNTGLIWQFAGTVHTTATSGDFPAWAFNPGSPPITPPSPIEPILLSANLAAGFAPIDLSGPVVAFDDAVQIGTWEVRVTEAVPEPGSLLLMGIGLAALAVKLSRARAA